MALVRTAFGIGPPLRWAGAGILAAGVLLGGTAGRCEDSPPTFDTAVYCTGLASYAVNDAILRKGCLSNEGKAERHVRALWGETPEQVRADCLGSQLSAGPSYQGLSNCMARAVGALWMSGELRLAPR